MKVNVGQIRVCILIAMDVAHPQPQTHEDMARKLSWLANPHRIAINMDKLAREGVLTVLSDLPKRYALPSLIALVHTGSSIMEFVL